MIGRENGILGALTIHANSTNTATLHLRAMTMGPHRKGALNGGFSPDSITTYVGALLAKGCCISSHRWS